MGLETLSVNAVRTHLRDDGLSCRFHVDVDYGSGPKVLTDGLFSAGGNGMSFGEGDVPVHFGVKIDGNIVADTACTQIVNPDNAGH